MVGLTILFFEKQEIYNWITLKIRYYFIAKIKLIFVDIILFLVINFVFSKYKIL